MAGRFDSKDDGFIHYLMNEVNYLLNLFCFNFEMVFKSKVDR